MFDPELYREKQEVEEWKKRDPIVGFTTLAQKQELVADAEIAQMEKEIADEMAASVAFAEAGEWEAVEELTRFVYSEERGNHG
jgi:TPP-dependent pyruvate/acetoin dehydrogenase alpha subunit